jgi:lysine-specific demethylase 8
MKTLIRKISPQHVGQISGTKPVLIQGLCKHWPAVVHIGSENSGNSDSQSWSLSNLKRRLQHRLVQIEVGGDYMHENMTVNTVPFEIFADFLESDLASTALADDSPRVYVREQQIYLAQQELADVDESLVADIDTPPLLQQLGRGDRYGTKFWCGPAMSQSPAHFDVYNNVLCCVHGRKSVRLLPPEDAPRLKLAAPPQSNTSTLPLYLPVEEILRRHPQYSECRPVEVKLEPGDGLFIPPKWFHFCQNETVCISVNFWWL